jgi:hypothetical protein
MSQMFVDKPGGASNAEERELTFRLKQLHKRPDGDVLEGLIWRAKESDQVGVKAAFRLVPDRVKGVVVVCRFRGEVADGRRTVALHFDRGRVGERDEDFADAGVEQLRFEVVYKM